MEKNRKIYSKYKTPFINFICVLEFVGHYTVNVTNVSIGLKYILLHQLSLRSDTFSSLQIVLAFYRFYVLVL